MRFFMLWLRWEGVKNLGWLRGTSNKIAKGSIKASYSL